MKITALLMMSFFASSAMATDLKECENKIVEMLENAGATASVRLVENEAAIERVDQYYMSANRRCGVELVDSDKRFLTVSRFKKSNDLDINLTQEKFETIILNGDDPTYTSGRVKAQVSCKITESGMEYTTKVPVLTDGIRSPFAIEELSLKKNGNKLYVRLRSSVTPINWVFGSVTDCTLETK